MMLNALVLIRSHWKLLAGALAVLAIIGAVLLYGSAKYDQGVSDERARQAAHALAAAKSRGQVDQAIGRLPDGAALDELRRNWARD
ncbi:hypothetical protein ACSBPU_12700 [Parapusillimonas sp. JC17]|uniref:hypothetical protein n=1 Tax=Parapusillimonas sp. JC17 TaxID=3445768 RepID=UPI003FA0C8D4